MPDLPFEVGSRGSVYRKAASSHIAWRNELGVFLMEERNEVKRMSWEAIIWISLNVIFPLMIIPLLKLIAWLSEKPVPWNKLFSDGQLCFYCSTISAVTIHDLITPNAGKISGGEMVVIVFLIFLIVATACIFSISITHQEERRDRAKLA